MRLAINHGKPVREKILPYSRHTITEEDKQAVLEVLDSDWIAGGGPKTAELESALCAYTGYKYAVAVSSATAGLMLAYKAAFEGHNYPLAVPTYTFVATVNSIVNAGFDFRLIDIDEDTLCTKEFEWSDIGVSFAGFPVNNCGVADDAQYIHPSMSRRNVGVSVVSTHAVKQMQSGEGGVILTDDANVANFCYDMRNHGRNNKGDCHTAGYNFRMTDFQAALLLSQLKREPQNLQWRNEIATYYYDNLNTEELILPAYHPEHAWHLFTVYLHHPNMERDWFRAALWSEGIGTQVHFKPVHQQPLYANGGGYFPVADAVYRSIVSIPMFSGMTEQDMKDVVTAINKVLDYG